MLIIHQKILNTRIPCFFFTRNEHNDDVFKEVNWMDSNDLSPSLSFIRKIFSICMPKCAVSIRRHSDINETNCGTIVFRED